MCVTWFIHVCDMIHSCVSQDSFMCVTWFIHVCDTARVYLIHKCGMTHSCVWHDSFMCVTWFIHVRGMIHSCVWHGEGIPHSSQVRYVSHIWMGHVTHMNGLCHTHEWVMAQVRYVRHASRSQSSVCTVSLVRFLSLSLSLPLSLSHDCSICDMSHVSGGVMSHVLYEWVTSHVNE